MRCRLVAEGRVQGVGFRFFAALQAEALGVAGFVRNLADGRVEAEAEGAPRAVEEFVERLRRGPRGAAARDLRIAWLAPSGEDGFRIA